MRKAELLLRKAWLLLLSLFLLTTTSRSQDMKSTPLTLEAAEDGTISIVNPGELTIEYSKNGGAWTPATANPITIDVAAGDAVQLRGNNAAYGGFSMALGEWYTRITATNNIYVYGNVMSLVDATGFATATTLVDTSEGYGANLGFLFSTPEMEGGLFPKENTTIRNHPTNDIVLPATTLTPNCYMYMFSGCAGLTRAPQLPAVEMKEGCYHRLFDNCTNLTTAPTLPAKKLAPNCYSCMFAGCASLNYVKCMATDITADWCLDSWMEGVPAGGTFVKATTNNSWTTGINGIPEGWLTKNATEEDGDMGATPFTMEAIDDGTITVKNPLQRPLWWSKNGSAWVVSYSTAFSIDVAAGDKVRFRADVTSYSDGDKTTNFTSSGNCYIYGNIMSLLKRIDFPTLTTISEPFAFMGLFLSDPVTYAPNTTLKSHPYNELTLPATTLSKMCYTAMFHGCQGLTSAPALPATKLAEQCYEDMFAECSGLTEAPALPATKLATGCYAMMFYACTSLTRAPVLPARNVPLAAYDGMFSGCSNLSYVKSLATSLHEFGTSNWLDGVAATGTFVKMSQMHDWPAGTDGIPTGWTVNAATEADGDDGAVPLTLEAVTDGTITIKDPKGIMINYEWHRADGSRNYASFNADKTFDVVAGEKLILKATNSAAYGDIDPSLATRIASTADIYVYGNVMSLVNSQNFASVTTLPSAMQFACLFGSDGETNTTIKNHPTKDIIIGGTTLTDMCYVNMFAGCQGLTRAPELPATTMTLTCYHNMFMNCTGLTIAPVLPAPALTGECYSGMFHGCSNLNYVKCLATSIEEHSTGDWLYGVAAEGTFIAADGMTGWTTGPSGIPTGWRTTELPPLTVEAIEDGTTFTFKNPMELTIEYSTDDGTTWTEANTTSISISGINAGEKVQLRGNNAAYSTDGTYANSSSLTSSNPFYAYGNIMSMISAENYSTTTTLTEEYALARFFCYADNMMNHPTEELLLPATTLSPYCYHYMFYGCDAMTTAPALPATTLARYCYNYMFAHCYALTNAPALPATTLAEACYRGMFLRCDALATAPALPATTMAKNCYLGMFYSSGLTVAPALPATTLAYGCYYQMFTNCKGLTASPVLTATTLEEQCYKLMFQGCTSLEAAGDLSATTAAPLCCEYMFSGCTSLTKAPALPATTLASQCYQRMFEGCTQLVTAPALPATTLAELCYNDMFWECTALKNAPVLPATTLVPYCYTMMFYGCSALEKAPDLPAVKLEGNCYEHMFMNCTSLNYVKCLAVDLGDETATEGWMDNVAATGTFDKAEIADWGTGVNGIPTGWNAQTEAGVGSTETLAANADGEGSFWATYYNGSASVLADAGTTVYTAKLSSDKAKVELTAVADRKVPTGNAVVLKSTAASITLSVCDATGTLPDNELEGQTTYFDTPANLYALAKDDEGVGFFHYPIPTTFPRHKAYLLLTAATARSFIPISEGTATGIDHATDTDTDGDALYDLSGRKLTGQPRQGIYMKNGKKIIVR